ncbi:MAG: CoA-transferase [Dehalococcoidales bacterium]
MNVRVKKHAGGHRDYCRSRKREKIINGKEYIFELVLTADFALIKAHKADTLVNPIMATG